MTEARDTTGKGGVEIDEVTQLKERGPLQMLLASQAFWVLMAVVVISIGMSLISPPVAPPWHRMQDC